MSTQEHSRPEHLVTVEQVAERLAVSRNTVRRLADDGSLVRVHVGPAGRLVRFRSTDVERLMAPNDDPAPAA
ncbi:MAG: helix-turn-helix domain-containing protein [Actinomycetota bacterium]|nr:helix-turn-helix domain-containing protein [Actinomycetota bacterium]MDP9344595.1 helix-turn-helix domain-containing protein [Actinomycetota bacterium]